MLPSSKKHSFYIICQHCDICYQNHIFSDDEKINVFSSYVLKIDAVENQFSSLLMKFSWFLHKILQFIIISASVGAVDRVPRIALQGARACNIWKVIKNSSTYCKNAPPGRIFTIFWWIFYHFSNITDIWIHLTFISVREPKWCF